MTELEHDPLIARLRRADPAASNPVVPLPNRAALERRRKRRSTVRATRVAAGAAAVAGAVTLAVSLGPSGGPTVDDVLARATAATAPPVGKIVEMRVRVDAGGPRGSDGKPWSLWEERSSWVRFSSHGRALADRTLYTDGSPGENGRSPAGVDEVYALVAGKHVSTRFDPAKKDLYTDNSQPIPGLTFKAHRLLEAAQDGDARVRLDGEETIDGRRAYRLVVSGWDEPELPPDVRERRELLVDTETYQPIIERVTTRDETGGEDKLSERVVTYRELPDTPENRRLLELHGGEAQSGTGGP